MSAKLERCLRLVDAFIMRRELATRDVAQVLDVDKQTASRDLAALLEADFPIERIGSGMHTRYRLDEGYRKSRFRITQGDAFALCFGRQLLDFVQGTPISEWHDDLSEKVGTGLGRAARERDAVLEERLRYVSEPYRPYEPHGDALEELLGALLNERELDLTYASAHEERRWERVQPLALVVYRRALYLFVRFTRQEKTFRLAVDRITGAQTNGRRFEYPKDFDVDAELERGFGILDTGQEPDTVQLQFDKRVAYLVRSRIWHPTQSFRDLPDGGVELRFEGSGRELVRLALEFGETVTVVAPEWLRQAVIDELRNALALYNDPSTTPPTS